MKRIQVSSKVMSHLYPLPGGSYICFTEDPKIVTGEELIVYRGGREVLVKATRIFQVDGKHAVAIDTVRKIN